MKKLLKFVKNGVSAYNLMSTNINATNQEVFITNIINKGHVNLKGCKNKPMMRKMRRQAPRGKAYLKMYVLGFRMK